MSATTILERIPWRIRDLADKVGSTFAQAFLATLVGGSFFLAPDVDSATKAGLAGVTAVITLILGVVSGAVIDPTLPLLHQAALRVGRTAIAASLGWLASVPLLDLDQLVDGTLWRGVWFALATAALAAIKAEIARHLGDTSTVGLTKPTPADVLDQLLPARQQLEHAGVATVDVIWADGSRSTIGKPAPTFTT